MTTQEQNLLDNMDEKRIIILLQKAFDKKRADMATLLGENLEKLPEVLAQLRSKKGL
jgi:hypothetical protein